ncbi:hypothetical protein KIPB_001717, partial [Kipferlia bialata]
FVSASHIDVRSVALNRSILPGHWKHARATLDLLTKI